MQSRPRALVMCPEAPYPVMGGGPLRTASILEYLSGGYHVDLILFRERTQPDPRTALPPGRFGETLLIDLPRHSKSVSARAARNFRRLAAGAVPLVDRFSGFERVVETWLDKRQYNLGLIEHFWCAPYARVLKPHSARMLLDLHNVESVFLGRCAETAPAGSAIAYRRFSSLCRALERRWLPEFSLVLLTSAEDAAHLPSNIPSAVYPSALPLQPEPARTEESAIAFSGNFAFAPNLDAVRWFRDAIWPAIQTRHPNVEWRLIGKDPAPAQPLIRGDSHIHMTGMVEDAVRELARAQVAVVPIRFGSGTRLKIVEAWAAATPVVSTTLGAEGLGATPGEHLLIADTPSDFARAVLRLLESATLRREIGQAGRQLYERRYTWPTAWNVLRARGI